MASLVPVPIYSSQDGQPTGNREYQGLACPNDCDAQVPGPGSAVVMFLPASEPDGGLSGNGSYSGNRPSARPPITVEVRESGESARKWTCKSQMAAESAEESPALITDGQWERGRK